jgi:hypothetical protein
LPVPDGRALADRPCIDPLLAKPYTSPEIDEPQLVSIGDAADRDVAAELCEIVAAARLALASSSGMSTQ